MARKSGRDVHGWVIVDKPAGIGSTEVVARVRRAFDARKAGHAGTLDPAATGVLAVALGEATKTVPYVQDGAKTYRFAVRFGAATDTDDAEGRMIATSGLRPARDAVAAALAAFRGDILQVPPQVSAVRVAGARAYDLAREGIAMDLAARPLHIARLDLVGMPDAETAILEMVCGKGGYVRSVARDLGAALGCLGHALWLRRRATGPFDEGMAVALEAVGDGALRPLEAGLAGLPVVEATAGGAERLRHGNPGAVLPGGAAEGQTAWALTAGRPLAVGQVAGGMLHPARVFNL
jgi:tRNA pseudouridine55 synthase